MVCWLYEIIFFCFFFTPICKSINAKMLSRLCARVCFNYFQKNRAFATLLQDLESQRCILAKFLGFPKQSNTLPVQIVQVSLSPDSELPDGGGRVGRRWLGEGHQLLTSQPWTGVGCRPHGLGGCRSLAWTSASILFLHLYFSERCVSTVFVFASFRRLHIQTLFHMNQYIKNIYVYPTRNIC